MDPCCGPRDPRRYDAVFDSVFAAGVARRYARRGLRAPERRIVDFLLRAGIAGASVLEVGGGIGEIQLELLKRGVARAVNLELSAGYEEDAMRLAEAAGVAHRLERRVGVDLAQTPDEVEAADVVILHRVVCCYPDYEALLGAAAEHALRTLVFSHPPANPLSRLFIGVMNSTIRASGRSFRGFIHPPGAMVEVLRSRGLEPVYRWSSPVWRVVGARRRI
ncbi:2-polyprenyl-3-methyl-5-hydroxy-6-metoxy-1,4-benzoquinol methylase [Sinomonas sp. RB5]